jgi:hypothetical protein
MKLKFLKIKEFYQKEGLYVSIIHSLNYFFFKFFKSFFQINTPLHKYKMYLVKKIIKISNNRIMYGLYKNVYFNFDDGTHWNYLDIASKLTGFYEEQIQNKIIEIKNKYKLINLVNIGAAEGYHVVSLVKHKYFNKGYAFEIDQKGRDIIKKNIIKNNIVGRIKIFGEGNYNSIKNNVDIKELRKTLFLIDIEKGEFKFFDKKNINFFKKSCFIIEYHGNIKFNKLNNIEKEFFNLIKNNFKLEIIRNSGRNPFKLSLLEEFSDDERWLMMSETRPNEMIWLALTPKN